ncbi:MAG: xanthine dehydrogenase family protein subunit M [Candidatus Zixiibacteriota bacterium]
MSLPKFEYVAPKTVKEACKLLSKHRGRAKVLAGGTDLLVKMKNREQTFQYLVGIKNIADLNYIHYNHAVGLRVGALTCHQSIANSSIIRDQFAILAMAATEIGSPQIRNMGTIGGNLCNALPSADTASPLIALRATVKLVDAKKERTIDLEKFFTGPGQTVLNDDELLTEIQVPSLPPRTGGIYLKLYSRGAVDIATAGVACILTLGKNETCEDARIVLAAVAPTPLRAKLAEEVIKGKKIEDRMIEEAGQAAFDEAKPRSSPEYKREMVRVLTKQAIMQSLEQAKQV